MPGRARHRRFGLALLAIMAIFEGMDEAASIIDALGGNAAVAAALGERTSNVWRWRQRGIPARYWHRIAELAREQGNEAITVETVRRPLWQRGAAGAV